MHVARALARRESGPPNRAPWGGGGGGVRAEPATGATTTTTTTATTIAHPPQSATPQGAPRRRRFLKTSLHGTRCPAGTHSAIRTRRASVALTGALTPLLAACRTTHPFKYSISVGRPASTS